jgi:uncharacterized membrane protein YkvI
MIPLDLVLWLKHYFKCKPCDWTFFFFSTEFYWSGKVTFLCYRPFGQLFLFYLFRIERLYKGKNNFIVFFYFFFCLWNVKFFIRFNDMSVMSGHKNMSPAWFFFCSLAVLNCSVVWLTLGVIDGYLKKTKNKGVGSLKCCLQRESWSPTSS